MDYITTKEAAAKWNVSDRRVLQYCNADRIKGHYVIPIFFSSFLNVKNVFTL